MGDASTFGRKRHASAFVIKEDAPAFVIKGDTLLEMCVSFTCIIRDAQ
jgi:hypothetical protein